MNAQVTEAIILSRTDFGEADRILTLLTPDHGKLRLMAKGVRRVKSKLAGGIELFSTSTITFVKGKGEIGTLVSTRLLRHYSHIVKDLDRTMMGYKLIKELNTITEDQPDSEYFDLLKRGFEALDNQAMPLQLISFWFTTQLLRLTGHMPNLQTDKTGQRLDASKSFDFDFEQMCFAESSYGKYTVDHIKFLRLSFTASHSAKILAQVQGRVELTKALTPLLATMMQTHLRI